MRPCRASRRLRAPHPLPAGCWSHRLICAIRSITPWSCLPSTIARARSASSSIIRFTRRPIATVLGALGLDAAGITDNIVIFLGGPVSPNIAFALHSTDYRLPNTMDIDGRVALTQAAEVLRDLGRGHGPKRSLIAFGYAGWAPHQLDDEIAR